MNRFERYLYKSPSNDCFEQQRKIVLAKTIFESFKTASNPPPHISCADIRKAFTDRIMAECKLAHESKQNILFLMLVTVMS